MRTVTRLAMMGAVLLGAGHLGAQAPGDYPQWRGPSRDGIIRAFTSPRVWPRQLTRQWKVDVGPGYATPLVVGPRLFVFAREGQHEVLSALDARTGRRLWASPYPAPYAVSAPGATRHGNGPKGTPAYADGRVFTLGISGILTAFDAATGRQLWQKAAPSLEPKYGTATSPLVDRGVVIVHLGGHDQGALTALDAVTGTVKWAWTGDGPGYASPVIAEFGGVRQVVSLSQEHVIGVDVATGALLWKQPFKNAFWTNIATPVIYRDTVVVSANGVGTRAFRVAKGSAGWSAEPVWTNEDVQLNLSNPVLVGDALIGMSARNSGQFFSLDVRTGGTHWKSKGREGDNASIAYVGSVLLMLKESGELVVARPSAAGLEILETYTVADSATYGQPALTGNRVYVKDDGAVSLWTAP